MLGAIVQDVRLSVRLLRTRLRYCLIVIATLGLAIGANVAVFSAIEGQLLRPLPYPESDRLVAITNVLRKQGVADAGNTVPDYLDRREQATLLADSALYYDYSFDLSEGAVPQRVAGVYATPSLFSTLGVGAALGRTFVDDEARLGSTPVVLLSHALWQAQFAADPQIVGRQILVSGKPHSVVGVMPATFAFPRRSTGMWLPAVFTDRQRSDAMRGFGFAQSIGRLRPSVTLTQLNAQLDAIVAHSLSRFATLPQMQSFAQRAAEGGFGSRASSLHDRLNAQSASVLWLLQAAVSLLLIAGCANVSNMLLMRFADRRSELSLRLSLGATPGRLARQLQIENMLLVGAGGVVGVAIAYVGITLIRALGLDGAEHGFAVAIRPAVLAFAVLAVVFCSGVLGLVSTLVLRRDLVGTVKSAGRGMLNSPAVSRHRRALVVAQLAIAVALLSGTAMLGQSVWRLQQSNPGFNADDIVTLSFNLSRDKYPEQDQIRHFNAQILTNIRAIPGVAGAGTVDQLPFSADFGSAPYFVEASTQPGDAGSIATIQGADTDYFQTMQIPLLRGRWFTPFDRANSEPVTVIDQALAAQAFADRDPLGQRIGTAGVNGTMLWRTVVGVVGTVRTRNFSTERENPVFFVPHAQQPVRIFRVVLKTALSPAVLADPIRAAVARIDPSQPVWDIKTMHARIDASLGVRRAPSILLLCFAAVSLAISVLGLYGVLAHSVSARTAEVGVRMSLGASRIAIVRLILADGARLVIAGAVLGTALAVALSQLLQAKLVDVLGLSAPALIAVLVVLLLVSAAACWLPARRAGRISPMNALRAL